MELNALPAWAKKSLADFESALESHVKILPESGRSMAQYYFGFPAHGRVDEPAHRSEAGIVSLLSSVPFEHSREQLSSLQPLLVAIALDYAADIILDDLVDGDASRRGRDTVWRSYGKAEAVLLADLLHAESSKLLVRTRPEVRGFIFLEFAEKRANTAHFQLLDSQRLRDITITSTNPYPERALKAAGGRSAPTLQCALMTAFILNDGDDRRAGKVRAVSESFGVAFQLSNDWQNIWGNASHAGSMSDVERRKPTALMLRAMEVSDDHFIEDYLRSDAEPTLEMLKEVQWRLVESGAKQWLEGEVVRHLEAMNAGVACLGLSSDRESLLSALLQGFCPLR